MMHSTYFGRIIWRNTEPGYRLTWTAMDAVNTAIAGTPESISWASLSSEDGLSIELARERYRAQPRVIAFNKFAETEQGREICGFMASVDGYTIPRIKYLQNARNGAIATFGFLKDGHWVECGNMGWFGHVSNEKDNATWQDQFNQMLDTLPDDTLLTVVDCHI